MSVMLLPADEWGSVPPFVRGPSAEPAAICAVTGYLVSAARASAAPNRLERCVSVQHPIDDAEIRAQFVWVKVLTCDSGRDRSCASRSSATRRPTGDRGGARPGRRC